MLHLIVEVGWLQLPMLLIMMVVVLGWVCAARWVHLMGFKATIISIVCVSP